MLIFSITGRGVFPFPFYSLFERIETNFFEVKERFRSRESKAERKARKVWVIKHNAKYQTIEIDKMVRGSLQQV